MDNLVVKSFLKLTAIAAVISACTFGYSVVESHPPKVISFFIITLISSFAAGIVVLLLGRLLQASKHSFIGDPFRIILSLVLVIGVAKIFGAYIAKNQISEDISLVDDDINEEAAHAIQTFDNVVYGVSFRYPSNWLFGAPQRKSTLILLNEITGSQATCNLSVIVQDHDKIEKYDEAYHKKNFLKMRNELKMYESVENVVTQFRTLNNKKVSWTTCHIVVKTERGSLAIQFTTVTALHKGQRFMMVLNIPKESLAKLDTDIATITNSLTFR